MFKTLFDFILNRKGHPAQTDSVAPYKAEAPVVEVPTTKIEPMKCGCGRSPSGYCVGLHGLSAEEWNKHPANPAPVVEAKPEAPAKKVKKAPAKPKAEKKQIGRAHV